MENGGGTQVTGGGLYGTACRGTWEDVRVVVVFAAAPPPPAPAAAATAAATAAAAVDGLHRLSCPLRYLKLTMTLRFPENWVTDSDDSITLAAAGEGRAQTFAALGCRTQARYSQESHWCWVQCHTATGSWHLWLDMRACKRG